MTAPTPLCLSVSTNFQVSGMWLVPVLVCYCCYNKLQWFCFPGEHRLILALSFDEYIDAISDRLGFKTRKVIIGEKIRILLHNDKMVTIPSTKNLFFFFLDYLFIYFRERGREGEREREKHQYVAASHSPLTGDLTWPATQACALTGNLTGDSLVHRPVLNSLSHTSQGQNFLI